MVGDDDQSIYAWRGASIANLHNLRNDYPKLRVIKLEQNYRSSQRILKVANHLINHNTKVFEKKLWSDTASAMRSASMQRGRRARGRKRGDEADRAQVRASCPLCRLRDPVPQQPPVARFRRTAACPAFPYTVSGGTSFFDRAEIKDIIAYLRLIANPDDDPALSAHHHAQARHRQHHAGEARQLCRRAAHQPVRGCLRTRHPARVPAAPVRGADAVLELDQPHPG